MIEFNVIIFTLFITLALNYLILKKNFLVDEKFNSHKSFASNNLTPITGGLILLISCLVFLTGEKQNFKIFLISIFIIGFLSDINFLRSPKKRFFYQSLIIVIFVYFNQTFINSIRISFIDDLLTNIYFKYFLTVFCFLILLNGSNFIDGVNTLLLIYFLSLLIVYLLVVKKLGLPLETENFKILIIIISIIVVFNSLGKLISGDGGAYLISFILGYFLIKLANITDEVSPYFIACLLWYPSYECLFSILRKKISKKSVIDPDNEHIHHLIFTFYKKNIKLKNNYINTITGLSINCFNIIIFYFAYQNISQTKNLIFLIIICLLFYNLTYFFLKWKINN